MTCTPTGAKQSDLTGDAATLLFSEIKAPDGSNWTVARSTEWTVRLALATSCAEACAESAASPARLDCRSEQFLTILSQLLMQLALGAGVVS